MARGVITPTQAVRSGVALPAETTGDASNGHTIANSGHTILQVRNSNGASTSHNVTINFAATVDGQTVAPRVIAVAAAATLILGAFDPSIYGGALLVDVNHAELMIRAIEP